MKTRPVGQNNSVNFGIRFIDKPSWNKELLSTLENSRLVKSIDNKYPNASVEYFKTNLTGFDLANDESNYMSTLIFRLADKKVSTFHINSHSSEGADRALNSYVSGMTFEKIEEKAKEDVEKMNFSVQITPIKKPNPVSRFFKRLYNKIFKD